MTKDQLLDEVRRLRHDEQVEVLECLAEMVASPLSEEEERGLADALDEADRGDLVDGATAFKAIRDRSR